MGDGESNMNVLFEHAAGFSLFKVREFEEESLLQAEVEECIRDFSKFAAVVRLVTFSPFKTAVAALENQNSISEGIIPDDLKSFLAPQLTKGFVLGVLDPKLGAAIGETFPKVKVKIGPLVNEITRGIRTHFHKMVKLLSAEAGGKAQLGLGHSYSRSKVKFNVNRQDNMIIQGIALLDQLDKDVNTFSMRIREWYSYHFPELVKIVPDNYLYAKVVHYIKDRKQLNEEMLDELEEIIGDGGKAKAILDASRSSMGMDISEIDLVNIETFATRVIKLAEYRKGLLSYLQSKMGAVAPNLTSLLGETVAARLISHAGSLTNLAKFPASTVQILGAEKALFRALKTRGKTPKYGLLFHSTFIGRAGSVNKGRISRFLANKCTIASRIDCFTEHPNSIFGEKLREQVEDRLKFYESGDVPRKNEVVMSEALNESRSLIEAQSDGSKKKKKKKRKADEMLDDGDENGLNGEELVQEPKKKKKKHQEDPMENSFYANNNGNDMAVDEDEVAEPTKKKKKKKAKA
ncbi:unnamed protein product [Orchesella dallaii]|uniref:Nucleolar protein 56 n=1 Tax=Orchesella dallaii TaxID=48710 RepID=A0ABP1QKD2_9HEXA